MARKLTSINKTEIATALREAAFDPRVPGPLKVIADVGNPAYYVQRANEITTEVLREVVANPEEQLSRAMGLLALAKVTIARNRKSHVDAVDAVHTNG